MPVPSAINKLLDIAEDDVSERIKQCNKYLEALKQANEHLKKLESKDGKRMTSMYKLRRLIAPDMYPNKPSNAYLMFVQEYQQDHQELSQAMVRKQAGEEWRSMGSLDKAPFVDLAKERFDLYKQTLKQIEEQHPCLGLVLQLLAKELLNMDAVDEDETVMESRVVNKFFVFQQGLEARWKAANPGVGRVEFIKVRVVMFSGGLFLDSFLLIPSIKFASLNQFHNRVSMWYIWIIPFT